MNNVGHLIQLLFVGALIVLVITHASGFSSAVTAVGGTITDDAKLLTGN